MLVFSLLFSLVPRREFRDRSVIRKKVVFGLMGCFHRFTALMGVTVIIFEDFILASVVFPQPPLLLVPETPTTVLFLLLWTSEI